MTVYGLSEEELPTQTCLSGLLSLPLEEFSYGSNQDCSNRNIDYVIFLRSTKKQELVSTDQLNHEKYRREVFLPYVESTGANYLLCEGWEPGDKVEDKHLWVNWQDGH